MQRLFERAKKQIVDFVEQRDDLIMVSSCADTDSAILLKLFRDCEQAGECDLYLLFADDFVMASPYVSVLAERLREERRIACEALREEQKPELPPIPDIVFDDRQHPSFRLYKAISYARSLLPRTGGHRLVWVMCPQTIADRRAYLELLSPFVNATGIQPWMHGLRLVVRDAAATAQFAPELKRTPRVRVVPFDFGQDAIARSLAEESQDESMPAEQRMQSLLQLALLDSAHGRNGPALEKFHVLLRHYESTRNLGMQALVLNGIGDVYHRAGDLDSAEHWYECAIPVAGEAKDGVVLLTIVKNLAAVAWLRGRFDVSEQYFDGVDKLAAHLLSPEAKIDALLWRGFAQERQGAYPKAIGSWRDAATLAGAIGIPELHSNALGHLERGYSQLGMANEAYAVRQERIALQAHGNQ